MNWNGTCDHACLTFKDKLVTAFDLGLFNLEKTFTIYVVEKQGTALDVPTQMLKYSSRPVVYFSEQLEQVAARWQECL